MVDLFHDLVLRNPAAAADRAAVTHGEETLDFQTLGAAARSFAGALLREGFGKHDRLAIYLDKRLEAVVAMLGASLAEGIFVPFNPQLRAPQAQFLLEASGARVLVTSAHRLRSLSDRGALPATLQLCILVGDAVEEAPEGIPLAGYSAFLASAPDAGDPARRCIDADAAAILFTSGSTGKPKGVVLSHRNIIASALSAAEHIENRPSDRLLGVLPFSFDYGLVQLTSAWSAGASLVLHNYLLPRGVIEDVERYACTGLAGVPPFWCQMVRQEWPPERTASLRYITCSGGRMPEAVLHKLVRKIPSARPHLMYGLTEAFRSTSLSPEHVGGRPTSIGRPIPNADVLIVREDGSLAGPNEIGELVHRGAFVSKGYWNNPEATAERFRAFAGPSVTYPYPEIAVWSGDLAYADEEGFFYYVGRRDHQIKTSGYRVSPTEVEEVIYATGMVAEAVAFGLDDEELGQKIAVVVVPDDPDTFHYEALLKACRRDLPLYMLPRQVGVAATLPRTPNGKIDRNAVIDDFRTGRVEVVL